MKVFEYTIKDELGIHARPAGLLVNTAKKFESNITIQKDNTSVGATKLIALMGLGIKQGDTIKIVIEGTDEGAAEEELKKFLNENL